MSGPCDDLDVRPGDRVGGTLWLLLAMSGLALPSALNGQTVRGRVQQVSGEPLPGVLLVLEDSTGAASNPTLSTETGEYRLSVRAPGSYRLRAERIGFATVVSTWLRLSEGEVLPFDLVVEPEPVRLRRIRVEDRARCEVLPDEGIELQRVWDEARKALRATAWTGQQPYFRFDAVMHQQILDRRGRPTSEPVLEEVRFYGRHPFRSIPVRDLVFGGFIQEPGGQVAYYAPDADVLLSETFVRRHCFRLVRGTEESLGLLGLAFETVPESRLPDIEGVMWIDPRTSELRWLDYGYVNVESSLDPESLGGRVEFARLPSGAWIIRSWYIRVPIVEWISPTRRSPGRYRLTGIDEGGGQVVAVWLTARIAGLLPTDTLHVTPPPDSLLMRFELIEPGRSEQDGDARQ